MPELDLSGIDLLIESTGKATACDFAERGVKAGAPRVLIAGPCPTADVTLMMGANDAALGDQQIVSCASCTTNAQAPLMRSMHEAFGVFSGHMTPIHCYTGSQPTVDAPRGDLVWSRPPALSMVPTTTSAGRMTDLVLPDLANRVVATSVRVPTASVSAIDMALRLERPGSVDRVNKLLKSAPAPVFGVTEMPLVSSDLRGRPESIVMALTETTVMPDGVTRVFGWYDNE